MAARNDRHSQDIDIFYTKIQSAWVLTNFAAALLDLWCPLLDLCSGSSGQLPHQAQPVIHEGTSIVAYFGKRKAGTWHQQVPLLYLPAALRMRILFPYAA